MKGKRKIKKAQKKDVVVVPLRIERGLYNHLFNASDLPISTYIRECAKKISGYKPPELV